MKARVTEDKKGTKVTFQNNLKDPLHLKLWLNFPKNKEGDKYTKYIDKNGWYFDIKYLDDILQFLSDRNFDIDYFGHKYQIQVESPVLIPYEKRIKAFTKEEIIEKRDYIHYQSGVKGNFTDLKPDDLKKIFHLYDSIFFDKCISDKLKTSKSIVDFETDSNMENIYGFCVRGKCKYTLSFPKEKYLKMFKSKEKLLRAGGEDCKDRLSCFQLTFEHELMHLIIMLYQFPVKDEHGLLFQCMMEAFFNQHGLYPEYKAGDVFGKLSRDTAKLNMKVKFNLKGEEIVGEIIKLLRNTTRVKELLPQKGRVWYGVKYSSITPF